MNHPPDRHRTNNNLEVTTIKEDVSHTSPTRLRRIAIVFQITALMQDLQIFPEAVYTGRNSHAELKPP
jgi:hypothetical protein